MKRILPYILVSFCLLGPLSALAQGRAFRAGTSAVDVTPTKLPVRVAGSIGEKYADRITDPLHARCLVLDDGSIRIALGVVDNCLISRELLDAAKLEASKATGIPIERMLISATHTHSAPVVLGVHGNEPELEYAAFLRSGIAKSIIEAYENLEPALIGWGAGECSDFVFCRRWEIAERSAATYDFTGRKSNRAQMNPGRTNPRKMAPVGPVDPQVTVLSVQTRNGEPLAVLANYSTHYVGAPQISADYFGVFANRIQERLSELSPSPRFVGILSNGTSGDANCIDFSREDQEFDRFIVGDRIAEIAGEVCANAPHRDWVSIGMTERRETFAVRMPAEEEVRRAQAFLDENLQGRTVRAWRENYARETVLLSRMPPTRELRLQALRIGEFAITAIPCEVYGATGLAIKELSPFSLTMNIGLANGYDGYLPPPEQFALGGYTTWRARSSCLEITAEPRIRAVVTSLLTKLRNSED